MTYTPDSPAVRRAVDIYRDRGGAAIAMAAVLNDHERQLRERLSRMEAGLAGEMRKTARLRKKLRRAEAAAATNAAAAALWGTSAALWHDATLAATNARNALAEQLIAAKTAQPSTVVLPDVTGEDVHAAVSAAPMAPFPEMMRAGLIAYRDRLEAALNAEVSHA